MTPFAYVRGESVRDAAPLLDDSSLAYAGGTDLLPRVKLGIAERTANFHFSNILSKLDALNRHEAIAKGMQLGLIHRDL